MNLILKLLPGAFTVILLGLGLSLQAQDPLEIISPPPTGPEGLIPGSFLGQGIEILNVQFEGDPLSTGYFRNGAGVIDIDQGLILSNGLAKTIPGQTGADAIGMMLASSGTASTAVDGDIQTLAGGSSVFDIQVYTIEFIPQGDSLQLTYVFASEEYPELNCTDQTDRFGIFISGPGIAGPFANNAENMAVVPGTLIPAGINSINTGLPGPGGDFNECSPPDGSLVFDALYNNNDGLPFFPVYDGFTDPLTNKIAVTPCQVYTIKLVIADVGDDQDDSALFFQAESFATDAFEILAELPTIDGVIAEGCSPANLTLELLDSAVMDRQIPYTIFGNAVEGVDFTTNLPGGGVLTFPEGDTSFTISFEALEDFTPEGTDSIFFELETTPCRRDTFLIQIVDDTLPTPVLRTDTTICPADSVALNGDIGFMNPPVQSFNFQGNLPIDTNGVLFSAPINVSGIPIQTVGPGVIATVCIDSLRHSWIEDVDVFLVAPNGSLLELTTDNGGDGGNNTEPDFYIGTCFSESATQAVNFPGPAAPFTALPLTGTFLPEGDWSALYGSPTNGEWQLLVIDDKEGDNGALLGWSISFSANYSVGYSWDPATGLDFPNNPDPIATPTVPNTTTDYVLTVSDSYGCETKDMVAITTLDVLPPVENVVCAASDETSFTITWDLLAGASSYEVSIGGVIWEPANGNLTHTFTNLRPNTPYIIFVRGVDNCPGFPSAQRACSTQPCTNLSVDIDTIPTRCPGVFEGGITFTPTGGTAPYIFRLDADTNQTGVFENLVNQVYTYKVEDSIGCEFTGDIYLPVVDTILVDMEILSGVLCQGDTNAVIQASANGPDGPYDFTWANTQTGAIADSFPMGFAAVQALGITGCNVTDSIFVSEPAALQPTTSALPISCAGASDGTILATTFGGTVPYQYTWTDTAGAPLPDTVGLPAGDYILQVVDANGCTASSQVTIPTAAALDVGTAVDPVRCTGGSDGRVQLTVSGGSGNYFYDWNTGSTDATLNNLSAGTYTVSVSDDNGCFINDTFTLEDPQLLEVFLSGVDISCGGGADGTIEAFAIGGTGSYTYNWNPGFIGDTSVAVDVPIGFYSLEVSDSLGCIATDTITLIEPDGLDFESDVKGVSCQGQSDGQIDLTVSGGAFPYTFDWSNGATTEDIDSLAPGNYEVFVTDNNGCVDSLSAFISDIDALGIDFSVAGASCQGETDGEIELSIVGGLAPYEVLWQDSSTENTLGGLAAGTYSVQVSDRNGCVLQEMVMVGEPEVLQGTLTTTDPTCTDFADGIITIQTTGGTAPYTYSLGGRTQNAGFFPALLAGVYEGEIVDANGCQFALPVVELLNPPPLEIPAQPDVVKSFQDSVSLNPTVQGGMGPYIFSWSDTQEPILSCLICPSPTTGVAQSTDFFFQVEDANGCQGEGVIRVVIEDNFQAQVPTGFTPDGNGQNDQLIVHGNDGVRVINFKVFNRWGELVFERLDFGVNEAASGWDGNINGAPSPAGVYVWVLEAEFPDGNREVSQGQTTLIR